MSIQGDPTYTAGKHGVAVCPGYIETPMMSRFTGGPPEGRAKVIDPAGRMENPRSSPRLSFGFARMGRLHGRHSIAADGGLTVQ